MSSFFDRRVLFACLQGCLLAWIPERAAAQAQEEFFDDRVLQEIRLTVSDRDWLQLKAHYTENTYYPADFRWKGLVVRNVGIRSRGSGTRNGIKPGIRVDMNRYVANQEFLGLKAVELKNMYADPSLLRESVAMKLFATLGIAAPREAHARLYVNNEYAGVYVIVESVDRVFISRLFGAREADVERGGYLYEYKWRFVYGFEYLGPDLRAYAALFEPQTRDTDAIANLYDPLEQMVRAFNQPDDDDFVQVAGRFIDLQELATYLAVEQFTVEWDGLAGNWGTNNFYLYRFREGHAPLLIPWDRDHAFTWDGVNAEAFIAAPMTLRLDTSVLTRRVLSVPALRQIFFEALHRCIAIAAAPSPDDPRGWLEREVDRKARLIEESVAGDPVFPFPFDQFLTELSFLSAAARERPGMVSCQITADPEAAPCQ